MIALLRRMIAFRAQATGRTVQSIYQEVVEVIRGASIPHTGDRPQCRICNGERTMVDRTIRDGALVIRHHHCAFCGWHFRSVEETDPAMTPPPPPPSGKIPESATTPPPAEHKESRGKRKRKRG